MDLNKELQSLLDYLSDDWENDQQRSKDSLLSQDRKENVSNFLRKFRDFEDKILKDYNTKEYNKFGKNTKHVLCLGVTGTGKSTVINHLIGNELECIRLGRNGRTFEIRVNGRGNEVADIGNSDDSQTVNITPYINVEKNIVYWDFPGFFDTQGDVQRIRNAYLMKIFSQTVQTAKIILFVDISTFMSRGVPFISFIDMLASVCAPELVQENMAILITKADPFESDEENIEEKLELVQTFARYSQRKNNPGIMRILGQDRMLQKLAFFEKPRRTGILPEKMFSDLISALQEIEYSSINFTLSVDSDTDRRIANIADLLNKYAKEISTNAAHVKASEVASAVAEESFTQDRLKEITPFSISFDKSTFIEKIQSSFGSYFMQNSLDVLKNILKTLNFFNQLNFKFQADIVNWAHPMTVFNEKYKQLCERPDIQDEGVMKITAAILSTSYLQHILKKTDKIVECYSLVLVVDSDLNLPGISLSIFSKIWNIKGDRKIVLKGNREKNIFHTGNFYGYAEEVKGGRIALELDGVDGEDGKFGLAHVQSKINDKEKEIKKLESYLEAVKYLESYKGKNLEEEIKRLTEREGDVHKHLSGINDKIIKLESALENFHSVPRSEDLVAKERKYLEKELKDKYEQLEMVQKELALAEKLNELVRFRDNYEGLPKKNSSNSLELSTFSLSFDQKTKTRLMSSIQNAYDEIFETETTFSQLLSSNENNLEEMQDILEKIETTLLSLANFVENQDTDYLEWKKQKQAAKTKYCKKQNVLVEGIDIELSAKDLNGILAENRPSLLKRNEKNKFEKDIENQLTRQRKLVADLNKMIQGTEEGIKRLREQQEKVKECVNEKAVKRKCLSNEIGKLPPAEFNKLKCIFHQISQATQNKNAVIAEYHSILREKDIYLGDSNSKSYLPEKREFYGDINKKEFYENCVQQIKKMEDQANKLNWVKDYVKTKIYVALFDAVHKWNELVSAFKISGMPKYVVDVPEITIRAQHKEACSKLEVHLLNDKPFEFAKYFALNSKAILQGYAKDQIALQNNLQKRLQNAQKYKKRMESTLENYEKVKKIVGCANRDYLAWKKQQKSNSSIPALNSVIDAYNELNASDKRLQEALVEEGKIVKELLLKETNLVKRVERKWGDRDLGSKGVQVLRSMFTFNDQYYESYKLSGSEGSPGNNSGSFHLHGNWDNYITVTNRPGKGGQHACTLEGTYLNEYSFAVFRRFAKPSNVIETMGKGAVAIPLRFLDDVISAIATDTAGKVATAAGVGVGSAINIALGGMSVLAMATSPGIAYLNSCWVDGPYKTYPGSALNGEKAKLDINGVNQCDNYGHNLGNVFSDDILSFF